MFDGYLLKGLALFVILVVPLCVLLAMRRAHKAYLKARTAAAAAGGPPPAASAWSRAWGWVKRGWVWFWKSYLVWLSLLGIALLAGAAWWWSDDLIRWWNALLDFTNECIDTALWLWNGLIAIVTPTMKSLGTLAGFIFIGGFLLWVFKKRNLAGWAFAALVLLTIVAVGWSELVMASGWQDYAEAGAKTAGPVLLGALVIWAIVYVLTLIRILAPVKVILTLGLFALLYCTIIMSLPAEKIWQHYGDHAYGFLLERRVELELLDRNYLSKTSQRLDSLRQLEILRRVQDEPYWRCDRDQNDRCQKLWYFRGQVMGNTATYLRQCRAGDDESCWGQYDRWGTSVCRVFKGGPVLTKDSWDSQIVREIGEGVQFSVKLTYFPLYRAKSRADQDNQKIFFYDTHGQCG